MPVIGIVIGAVGASMGTAAFAGTALAAYGSAIGAGLAGGLYSSSQGGDFGKGFLMGAAGNYIGGQISKAFGGASEAASGLSEEAFQAADYANLAGQGLDAGAIGQNMGAAADNWGGVMGDMSNYASAGTGEMAMTDADFAASTGYPQADTMNLASDWEAANTGYVPGEGMTIGIDHGMPESSMSPWTSAGDQGNGVITSGLENPTIPATLENITKPDNYQSINPYASYPGSSSDLSTGGLDNVTSTAPASGGNPAGVFGPAPQSTTGFMDRMKGWVSDSDATLAKFGMPKGSTALGLAGMGQYMVGNYETYKAEQIAKGMKPMTLEEFQNKMYNPNDYKVTANSMAQSGRTGTLPVLLARMKQQSSMDYHKNYLPNANQNWWDVNANVANMRLNNYSNLTKPLSGMWAMNKAQQ